MPLSAPASFSIRRAAWLRRGAAIASVASLLALSACLYLPSPVGGVPAGGGWFALPLRAWIAEGGVRAEAVGACPDENCAERVAVGVFAAEGADAAALSAVLRDPTRLKRGLEDSDAADADRRRRAVRTVVETAPLVEPGLEGFGISLARADGARPPAHGAVLARRDGARLRFVIVVGSSAATVRATAVSVARAELGGR